MEKVGIGIIGCGNISEAYLKAASGFPILDIRGVADLQPEAAQAARRAVRAEGLLGRRTAARPVDRDRRQPDDPGGACGGRSAGASRPASTCTPRSRSALTIARRAQPAGRCGQARPARRLRAGHLPRRLAPDLPQARRRRRDRPAGRRQRLLHVPGPRALASEPGLLLRRRRRADARHGAVLHHGAGQPDRAGRARRGRDGARARTSALITSEPLRGRRSPVEVATHVAGTLEFACGAVVSIATSFDVPKHRHAPIELYGTEASLIVPDPNQLRRPDRDRARRRGLGRAADRACLRRRQLPQHRRGRHGACDPRRAGRIVRPANWRCTCSR